VSRRVIDRRDFRDNEGCAQFQSDDLPLSVIRRRVEVAASGAGWGMTDGLDFLKRAYRSARARLVNVGERGGTAL